jgi:DNA-binding CsgD family transcriptional regulator/tetratricopeptide (TPR) repeat protein
VTAAVEEAVAAGCLVTDGSEYGFRHELLREAVYESLVPSRRRALHEALARTLAETGGGNAAAVARHWLEGGHPSEAAACSITAAEEAERLHAPGAAHIHFERVLELWDELPASERRRAGGRGQVLARAAEAAFQASASERARELASAAVTEAADDPRTVPGRLERLARFQFVAGKSEEAEAIYEQALAAMTDDTPVDTRVQVIAGLVWRLGATGRSEDARPLVEAAVELADRSGDPLHRCRATLSASWVVDDAPTAAREARDLAVQVGADDEMARAYLRLVDALRERGFLEEAASEAHDGALACRDRNIETYRVFLTGWELGSLVDLGRWQEASRRLSGLPHEVRDMAHAYGLMHGARLGAATGDGDLVEQVHEAIRGFIGSTPVQTTPLLVASAGRAEHLLWQARPTAALEVAGPALALPNFPANYPHLLACLTALGIRAHADIARGARTAARPSQADKHVEAAARLAGDLPTSGDPSVKAWSVTAHAELARARNRRADDLWMDAVEAWSALSNRYQAAYCHWRLAETALAERTGRAAARQHLNTAWEAAIGLGAEPLTDATAALAGRARITLGGVEASDPANESARELGITPREREVLDLVARGRTNREVATILTVSTRTVDTHVSRLLTKLGVSRRTEAADVARRHGLVE